MSVSNLEGIFSLRWWYLTMDNSNKLERYGKKGYKAITICGMSKLEKKQIRRWCKDHAVKKISKIKKFSDGLSAKGIKDRWPNYTGTDLHWNDNEITVIDHPNKIIELMSWLDTLPKRSFEIPIRGISKSAVKEICRGSQYRLEVCTDDVICVSTDNKHVAAELVLKGTL